MKHYPARLNQDGKSVQSECHQAPDPGLPVWFGCIYSSVSVREPEEQAGGNHEQFSGSCQGELQRAQGHPVLCRYPQDFSQASEQGRKSHYRGKGDAMD